MIQVKNVGTEQKHYEGENNIKESWNCNTVHRIACSGSAYFYTVREYRPKSIEFLNAGNGTKTLSEGDSFSVLTYNTGYGALSKDEDFFMDGGRKVQPDRKEVVETNLAGISDILKKSGCGLLFPSGSRY